MDGQAVIIIFGECRLGVGLTHGQSAIHWAASEFPALDGGFCGAAAVTHVEQRLGNLSCHNPSALLEINTMGLYILLPSRAASCRGNLAL